MNKVLEVACGTGVFMNLLEEAGFDVTGIDLSNEMLSIAKPRVKGELHQMDMREINLPGFYDAVLCLGSSFTYMETDDDVDRALKCFNKMLPEGGVLVFDSFNSENTDPERHSQWQEATYEVPDLVIKRRSRNIEWSDDYKHWTTEWRYKITRNGETEEITDYSRLRAFDLEYLIEKLAENGFKYVKTLEENRLRVMAVKEKPRL